MAQVLGIVDVTWRGRRLDVEKGAKFKPGGTVSKPVVTGRKVDRAEEFQAGEVKATTTLKRGQRLSDVYTRQEGELVVLCDTGQTYSWPDAFLSELLEVTGGEGGKIELTWTVGEAEELLNG
jgi:glucose/arabinose dehydrogenase